MKVLVCGGRDYHRASVVEHYLSALHRGVGISHIIHGAARGADQLAADWAKANGVQEVACPANWDAHGKGAGPRRNRAMALLKPDLVVAFPGGRGTADMISVAEGMGIQVKRAADTSTGAT
jgi:cysteine synthase